MKDWNDMTPEERTVAVLTERCGWECVTFGSCADRPNGTVEFDKAWRDARGEWVTGLNDTFPPFADDTPEGWAAHKRWVEPWIVNRGLRWEYSDRSRCFTLFEKHPELNTSLTYTGGGSLPTAAIKACLELVRREKDDE